MAKSFENSFAPAKQKPSELKLTPLFDTFATGMNVRRAITCLALALSLGSRVLAAPPEYGVHLRGVIDVEGLKAALIELNYTIPGKTNERRNVTRLMRERDALQPDTALRLELLAVDAGQMKAKLLENEAEKHYAIQPGPISSPGTNRLALANASIPDTIDLLSLLTERVVLFHPESARELSPQIQCHWTNTTTSKAEAALAIQNSWRTRGVETVSLGPKYLALAPPSLTNEITRSWQTPTPAGPNIPPFALLNVNQALAKFTELTGQGVVCPKQSPDTWFYLSTLRPLSKAEAILSIKTLLKWRGCQVP